MFESFDARLFRVSRVAWVELILLDQFSPQDQPPIPWSVRLLYCHRSLGLSSHCGACSQVMPPSNSPGGREASQVSTSYPFQGWAGRRSTSLGDIRQPQGSALDLSGVAYPGCFSSARTLSGSLATEAMPAAVIAAKLSLGACPEGGRASGCARAPWEGTAAGQANARGQRSGLCCVQERNDRETRPGFVPSTSRHPSSGVCISACLPLPARSGLPGCGCSPAASAEAHAHGCAPCPRRSPAAGQSRGCCHRPPGRPAPAVPVG